jgi:hypothetical protein
MLSSPDPSYDPPMRSINLSFDIPLSPYSQWKYLFICAFFAVRYRFLRLLCKMAKWQRVAPLPQSKIELVSTEYPAICCNQPRVILGHSLLHVQKSAESLDHCLDCRKSTY